jgi:hypothetical protein
MSRPDKRAEKAEMSARSAACFRLAFSRFFAHFDVEAFEFWRKS